MRDTGTTVQHALSQHAPCIPFGAMGMQISILHSSQFSLCWWWIVTFFSSFCSKILWPESREANVVSWAIWRRQWLITLIFSTSFSIRTNVPFSISLGHPLVLSYLQKPFFMPFVSFITFKQSWKTAFLMLPYSSLSAWPQYWSFTCYNGCFSFFSCITSSPGIFHRKKSGFQSRTFGKRRQELVAEMEKHVGSDV